MPNYKLLKNAGPFRVGEIASDKQIQSTGASVEDWLHHKALEQVDEKPTATVPEVFKAPAPGAGTTGATVVVHPLGGQTDDKPAVTKK